MFEYTARSDVQCSLSDFALCLGADSTSTTVNKYSNIAFSPKKNSLTTVKKYKIQTGQSEKSTSVPRIKI
jgi:hypothetical protein